MRPADIESLLHDGITLAQAGQRHEARRMLHQVIEADPNRALAWMWLATVSDERDKRIEYLQRALALDPTSASARLAYEQLTGEIFIASAIDTRTGPPSARPRYGAPLVGGIVLALAVGVFIVALLLDDSDSSVNPSGRLTTATFEALLTPRLTPTPTPRLSLVPARTNTPRPTRTPGPSPTSIWDAPPPTWTLPPTQPPTATWTLAPTSTPNPSPVPFVAPAVRSATAAYAQTSDAAARPTASGTPASTATVDSLRATVNARFTQAFGTSAAIQTQIATTATTRP